MANSALFFLAISSPTSSNIGADALRRRLESSSWSPGPRRAGGSAIVRVRCEKRDDAFFMRRCVELARKAVGCTSPNPMVGCVVVKDGEIVGRGFHPKAGQPHAEVSIRLHLSFSIKMPLFSCSGSNFNGKCSFC